MTQTSIPSRKGKAPHIQTAFTPLEICKKLDTRKRNDAVLSKQRFLTGFILAAGLGERLRPITKHIPKPLLPILGKPVLQLILEKVLPFANTIGINLHHKKEAVAEYLNNSTFKDNVSVFYEEPILGTGGALKNAEGLLSKGAFLVHNADILSDIDLQKLIEFHFSSENIATLAVHDYKQFNILKVDENGFLRGISKGHHSTGKLLAFTGIAIYEPEFLNFLPNGASTVTDAWLKATNAGCMIGTMDISGCYWTDIGTPSAYASSVVHALRTSGETIYLSPDADCRDIEIDGYVAIEKGCKVAKGVSMRNCIVLPESKVANTYYENCILCGDIKIDLNEPEILGFRRGEDVLIGVSGSDRKYYRRKTGSDSEVFVRYAKDDADFHRHIEYTKFFRKHNIPVPELIDVDYENRTTVFEDLVDLSLYSWLKCKRKKEQIEAMYRKVLDIIIELHTTVTSHASQCPMISERVFDYEHARWETNYFMKEFIRGIKDMDIKNTDILNEEFHRLAQKADSFTKTIIHRDFQSQNIMITKGIPRLIDYQGARIGPPAYDVASILYDPYSRLEDRIRETILDYYIQQMAERNGKFKKIDFIESLSICRVQRHMQALGAYGFLSAKKGKKYFLKHIPEGLRLLNEDIKLAKAEYPELYKLINGL